MEERKKLAKDIKGQFRKKTLIFVGACNNQMIKTVVGIVVIILILKS